MSFSVNKVAKSDNATKENVSTIKENVHEEQTYDDNVTNYVEYEEQQEKVLISARSTSPPEPSSFTMPEHTDQDQEQRSTQNNTIPAWPKSVSCNDVYIYGKHNDKNKKRHFKLNAQHKEVQQIEQHEQRQNEEEEHFTTSTSMKQEYFDNATSKQNKLQQEKKQEEKGNINNTEQEEMIDVHVLKCYDIHASSNIKSENNKFNRKTSINNSMSNREENESLPLSPNVDLQSAATKMMPCALPPIVNSTHSPSKGLTTTTNKTVSEARSKNTAQENAKTKTIVPLEPQCFDNTRFVSITPSPCTQGLTSSTPYQSTNCDNDICIPPSYNSSTATDMQSPNLWHNIDSMSSNATVKSYKVNNYNGGNNNSNILCASNKKMKFVVNKRTNINREDDECDIDNLLVHKEERCFDVLNNYDPQTVKKTENKKEIQEEENEREVQTQKLRSSLDITLSAESLHNTCTNISATHDSNVNNDTIRANSDHKNSDTQVATTPTTTTSGGVIASSVLCNKHNNNKEEEELASSSYLQHHHQQGEEEQEEYGNHVCFHTCHKHITQATNCAAEAESIATEVKDNEHNLETATAVTHCNLNDSVSVQPMMYELCNSCKSLSRLERSVEHVSNGRRSRKNASAASMHAVFSMLKVCQEQEKEV